MSRKHGIRIPDTPLTSALRSESGFTAFLIPPERLRPSLMRHNHDEGTRSSHLFILIFLPASGQTVWLDALDLSTMEAGWGTPAARKSVDGNALSIAGKTYGRGVGTHAISTFVVNLGEKEGVSVPGSEWMTRPATKQASAFLSLVTRRSSGRAA